MPSQAEDIVAVRREILDLLRQQVQVLDSGLELSDCQLRECYDRQGRVQELREKLQASLDSVQQNVPLTNEVPASELSTAAFSVSSAVHTAVPSQESVANL